ncbi:hypothetical protein F5148DRAFT_1267569 [Russula earlei]|uniref:Uncharacterized protein n=1 Tax=Russula earlei TaxID=71964 RepID=A0ACC0TR80_9AGAM|nr:hypothetical protein F5148DRAFT_1267569 [Russula earlei]
MEAIASRDLTKKVVVDVCGEMLDLKETINGMTESLSVFADEVGTEGCLGGQANVTNIGGLCLVCPYHVKELPGTDITALSDHRT